MITKMFNLRCTAGHYHYAPNPSAWVGKSCMKGIASTEGKSARKCQEPMSLSKPPA